MSQSPNNEDAQTTDSWIRARFELSKMIKEGRSFSGHERNCCFLNTGRERFATISAVSGLDFADDGRAIAVVDWDQDGDRDLWISNRTAPRLRLMRNDTPTDGHFLSLRLVGNADTTSRDAIGARVEVIPGTPSTRRLVKTLRAGEGFLAQSSKWVHFGLGPEPDVQKVVVHWPGGEAEEFAGLLADRRYELRQGKGPPTEVRPAHGVLALKRSTTDPNPPSAVARIPLMTRLPMPSLRYRSFDGAERTVSFRNGHPILVNVWASWCQPCMVELGQLAASEAQLREAEIDVVALAADGMGEDPSDPEAAAAALRRLGFPFAAGRLSDSILKDLQSYHDDLLLMWRPLPVPTSFLVDAQGRLAVIYKGPVSVDQVIQDARSQSETYVARMQRAAFLPGRALRHPRVAKSEANAEIRNRFRVASAFHQNGRFDEAVDGFVDLLRIDPTVAGAHAQLGSIYLRQGQLDQAAEHCQVALHAKPDDATAHNTMGNVLASQGKDAQARSHYQKAISIRPDYADAYNNLGTLFARHHDLSEALRHFQRAVELKSDFAEAHNNLGSAYAMLGNLAQASDHYQRALDADPTYAEAHNNLATMYARRGEFSRAIEQYRRALAINPQYEEARANLQRAQERLRRGK